MASTDTISNVESDITTYSQTNFSIKTDAAMFTVFRKAIYSDTILAPIRELSTNAVDTCLEAGLPVVFDVHIPTLSSATFSVRDYGTGIPLDFLNGDFCVVGASTKRDSHITNGQFGMGRLSPLAYTTSCTVESFIDGIHHSYLLTVQEGIPVLIHLSSVPTSEPSGARFSFPVEPTDIPKFRSTAANLYKYFDYKPNINEELPTVNVTLNHDNFMLTDDRLGIVMGNVYYRLDTNHVQSNYDTLVLKVPIGKVSLTPGRESLNYDETTVSYLKNYVEEAEEELIEISNAHITSQPTDYLKLKAYSEISNKTPYSIRDKLVLPTSSVLTVDLDKNQFITSPLFTMQYKHPSYKTLRHPDTMYLNTSWFMAADYFIADQRSFQEALSEVENSKVVVFKPADTSAKNIKASTEALITALEAFGITDYTRASSYVTTPKAKVPRVAKPTSINVREIGHYVNNVESVTVADNSLYYVPLDGTCIAANIPAPTIRSIFLEHFPGTKLYGIANSNIPKIKNNPKFIDFIEHLKATYDENNPLIVEHVTSSMLNPFRRYYSTSLDNLIDCHTAPSYVTLALNNYKYLSDLPHVDLHSSAMSAISSVVPTTFRELTPVVTLENLQARYPILNDINHISKETLNRYFMLENHYEPQVSPPK